MKPEGNQIYRICVEESLIGVFAIDEANEIVEKSLYPRNPEQIASALMFQEEGELTKEVKEIVEKLIKRGFNMLIFSNKSLAEAVRENWDVKVKIRPKTQAGDYLRNKLEELATSFGWVENASKLYEVNHDVSELMAREAVRQALSERESIISRTVQLLMELDKTLNVLSSRLREWYGLHFPELGRLVENHEIYAKIVNIVGVRAQFQPIALSDLEFSRAKAEKICMAAKNSMGAPLGAEDFKPVKQLASNLLALYRYRRSLEGYLSSITEEVAPNLSKVAGPILSAKLIEKAGGIRELAMMPSSTIQILGAEKAMFRSLKFGSKPPKHGLIFQHPFVHTSPRRMRGRVSRLLASKLAIAARADAFSGRSIGEQLRKDLEAKVERIRK